MSKYICDILNKQGSPVDCSEYLDKPLECNILLAKQDTIKGTRIAAQLADSNVLKVIAHGGLGNGMPSFVDNQEAQWTPLFRFVENRDVNTDLSKEYLKCTVTLAKTKNDSLYVKRVDNIRVEAA